MTELVRRTLTEPDPGAFSQTPPLLRRIYLARGIRNETQLNRSLSQLIPPTTLGGLSAAVETIIEAIVNQWPITVAGDYDCDGATGTAIGYRGLRLLGARHVHTMVPDRAVHGYGLSTGLVDAMDPATRLIITVDSGTSSVEGVQYAQSRGMKVVITDHHLPGEVLPAAEAIVNPNLDQDPFPSKYLCGAGVLFYVLLAVRQQMRIRGLLAGDHLPDFESLLPIVAIGTVADLVSLDQNNRILIHAGLSRIRAGVMPVGLAVMLEQSNKNHQTLVASDIAFSIAPILNAAGRIETMDAGVRVLCTDSKKEAQQIVEYLLEVNARRKAKQAEMVTQAEELTQSVVDTPDAMGVTVYSPDWHAGIVGLVASKLKETLHRPVVAFAPAAEGSTELRGSGRSIPGVHLRDMLAVIDTEHPGLIMKFGGHAMAAGLSLDQQHIQQFSDRFNEVIGRFVDASLLNRIIYTDGELETGELSLQTAELLRYEGPWGQAFTEPVFEGVFDVIDSKILKDQHLRLDLRYVKDGTEVSGIHFFGYHGQPIPTRVRLAYELSLNEYRQRVSLQLLIRHLEDVGCRCHSH